MVVFSKLHPSRKPLLVLLAALLLFRSAYLPSPRTNTSNTVPLAAYSQPDPASHARFFPLHHDQQNHKSKLSLSSWQQLKSLLRIVIPSIRSREALLLITHSAFLLLRTVLSVAVAKLDGHIVKHLVSADGYGFLRGLALWFALAVPSIYTNSMVRAPSALQAHVLIHVSQIRYLQSKLSLRFRDRLTRYIHDLYLASAPHLRYYRVPLQGVDQYITADVESWAESVAGI